MAADHCRDLCAIDDERVAGALRYSLGGFDDLHKLISAFSRHDLPPVGWLGWRCRLSGCHVHMLRRCRQSRVCLAYLNRVSCRSAEPSACLWFFRSGLIRSFLETTALDAFLKPLIAISEQFVLRHDDDAG
jgi:hypothetical protein